jgi:hypothetical protein
LSSEMVMHIVDEAGSDTPSTKGQTLMRWTVLFFLGLCSCGSGATNPDASTTDGKIVVPTGCDAKDCGGGLEKNKSMLGVCYATGCTGVEAYDSCLQKACGKELKVCFGDDFFNGHYGGDCVDYIKCVTACVCGPTYEKCATDCSFKIQLICQYCLMGPYKDCADKSGCQPVMCPGDVPDRGATVKDSGVDRASSG